MPAIERSGPFFLDTNIFVYCFDELAPQKQQVARQLVREALATRRGVISTQVVQEFLNVALRRFTQPFTATEAREYLLTALFPLCQHFPTVQFYEHALAVSNETGYAFYDALIVTAATEMDCALLLSEDLQDGRQIHGVTIRNPFAGL